MFVKRFIEVSCNIERVQLTQTIDRTLIKPNTNTKTPTLPQSRFISLIKERIHNSQGKRQELKDKDYFIPPVNCFNIRYKLR